MHAALQPASPVPVLPTWLYVSSGTVNSIQELYSGNLSLISPQTQCRFKVVAHLYLEASFNVPEFYCLRTFTRKHPLNPICSWPLCCFPLCDLVGTSLEGNTLIIIMLTSIIDKRGQAPNPFLINKESRPVPKKAGKLSKLDIEFLVRFVALWKLSGFGAFDIPSSHR